MSGSVYGTIFKISTWGESHGAGVGVVVDGCPAGLPLNEEDIQKYLDRRKPGQSKFTTARSEGDKAEILSGVFEGKTTGTPISIVIRNTDQRSRDYSNIMDVYRPGHADYTFDEKYGFQGALLLQHLLPLFQWSLFRKNVRRPGNHESHTFHQRYNLHGPDGIRNDF